MGGWGFVSYYGIYLEHLIIHKLLSTFILKFQIILIIAIRNGDLEKLLVPVDSNGQKCGIDAGVQNKPYLFFFDLTKCTTIDTPIRGCKTPQVCVEKCPDELFILKTALPTMSIDIVRQKLICIDNYDKTQLKSSSDIENAVSNNECAAYYLPSGSCKYLN